MFIVEISYSTDKQKEEIKISHNPNSEISYCFKSLWGRFYMHF